jgi:hypothetical protein
MKETAAAMPSLTAQATSACAVIGKYARMSWKERAVGLREVQRIARQAFHRQLALLEHCAAILEVKLGATYGSIRSLIDR